MDAKEFERELMADFSAEGEMTGDMIERGSDGPEWAQHRHDAAWQEMADLAKVHAENAALRAEVERLRGRVHLADSMYKHAEAEVTSLREAILAAYRKGHHHTVNGHYQWCDQGGREVVEEIILEAMEEEE